MRSSTFALMLGAIAILTSACASTETSGPPMSGSAGGQTKERGSFSPDSSAQDATTRDTEPRASAKGRPSLPTASTGGEKPHEHPSASAGTPSRAPADSGTQFEAGITPLHQSEAPNDLETTRRIRQAVIQDDSLSFRAKNVMIVTNGDRVVLTGAVNTRAEADRIKGIAQSITPYRIEDRLEIRR